MFNRSKIKELEKKINDLDDRVYQLTHPFRFALNDIVYFFWTSTVIQEAVVMNREYKGKKKYYTLMEKDWGMYTPTQICLIEEDLYAKEDIKEKFKNIKEVICGCKTIRGAKRQGGKKKEPEGKD